MVPAADVLLVVGTSLQVYPAAGRLLDGRFKLRGPGLGRVRFRVGQRQEKPAAGVVGRLAGSVGTPGSRSTVGYGRFWRSG